MYTYNYKHLTDQQKHFVTEQMALREKSKGTAYLWLIGSLFVINGLQKFYLNRPIMGILYLVTGGFLYIGTLYDLFTLGNQVREYNEHLEQELIQKAMEIYPAPEHP